MDTPPTDDHTPRDGRTTRAGAGPSTTPVVEVRGLRCSYGDFEAVRGIDLQARRGQLLAVLGTNGAGKTTTMEVLEGRRPTDGGAVRVFGHDPHRHRRTLAARTGVVFQESALPDELTPGEFLDVWHQVAGGGRLDHRPVDEQLARVDLTHRSDVRIGALSGGERRRLDLAIALSADPELLFLDEPTAGLDPESRSTTWDLIRALLRTGTTVVLTTHYLEEAEALADHLAILHEGRIVVDGSLDDVVGARPAHIRFEIAPGITLPPDLVAGSVATTRDRGRCRVEVHTHTLTNDLRQLLAWAADRDIQLARLRAAEASLSEVFHDIRTPTTADEITS